jgi:hypothetical protein
MPTSIASPATLRRDAATVRRAHTVRVATGFQTTPIAAVGTTPC